MCNIQIETLGCRLNQIESESIAKYFLDFKFNVSLTSVTSSTKENPDTLLCIVNTCTVTQKAEQKARRIIRLLLKKFPNATIVVTGCYAQLSSKEICSIDKRICVIPGQIKSRISDIPQLLLNSTEKDFNASNFVQKLNEKLLSVPQEKKDFPENSFKLSTSTFLAHSRASLKIQDGCNNSCSYCAIHIARGHSVSIDVQTAIDRVKELETKGQAEVVLTTINIAQYRGKYGDEYLNFAKLLRLLLQNTKKIRFRISSLYPEIVDDEFCAVISDDRVQPHFHISVQSGSNKILFAMNRVYKRDDVISACKKIRSVKSNPFIACDIITGFPGESDEDFDQTLDLCNRCNFAWVHAFPYSERPGTPAAIMKNKVPQSLSGERAKKMTQWAINQKIKYVSSFIGKELLAVVETSNHCMTENFIHGEFSTDVSAFENKQITVRVKEVLKEKIIKGGEIEALVEVLK